MFWPCETGTSNPQGMQSPIYFFSGTLKTFTSNFLIYKDVI